jgi:hypothetical protein
MCYSHRYLESLADNLGLHAESLYLSAKQHITHYNTKSVTYLMNSYNPVDIKKTSSKWQLYLYGVVKGLFPNTNVHLNYQHSGILRSHSKRKKQMTVTYIIFPRSHRKAEFDIFIPSLSLAFEYHGAQHYKHTPIVALAEQQQRDQWKKEVHHFLLLTTYFTHRHVYWQELR